MDTLEVKVPIVRGTKEMDSRSKILKLKALDKPSNQPVRVGELMKGMENISSHPQRNEILKSIFSCIEFDPYA